MHNTMETGSTRHCRKSCRDSASEERPSLGEQGVLQKTSTLGYVDAISADKRLDTVDRFTVSFMGYSSYIIL